MKVELSKIVEESQIAVRQGQVPVALSPDGSRVFTTFVPADKKKKNLCVYETASGEQIADLATGLKGCTGIEVSADGEAAILLEAAKYMRVDGTESASIRKDAQGACFTSDGKTVIAGFKKSLSIWSVDEQKQNSKKKLKYDFVNRMRRLKDGIFTLNTTRTFSNKGGWEVAGQFIRIDEKSGEVTTLDALPESDHIFKWDALDDIVVLRGDDDYLFHYYSMDGEKLGEFKTPDELRTCYHLQLLDPTTVLTLDLVGGEHNVPGSYERRVRIWDLSSGDMEEVHLQDEIGCKARHVSVAGGIIAVGSDRGVAAGPIAY